MKRKEEATFKPGELVRLRSGGLIFTVTASKGANVELCHAAGTKLCRDKVLAVQLESAEKKPNNFELARLIAFLLERDARQNDEGSELSRTIGSIPKLLAKQNSATKATKL